MKCDYCEGDKPDTAGRDFKHLDKILPDIKAPVLYLCERCSETLRSLPDSISGDILAMLKKARLINDAKELSVLLGEMLTDYEEGESVLVYMSTETLKMFNQILNGLIEGEQ